MIKLSVTISCLYWCVILYSQVPILPNPLATYDQTISQNGYYLGDDCTVEPILLRDERLLLFSEFKSYFSIYPTGLDFYQEVTNGNRFKASIFDKTPKSIRSVQSNRFDNDSLLYWSINKAFLHGDTITMLNHAILNDTQRVFSLTKIDTLFNVLEVNTIKTDSFLWANYKDALLDSNGDMYIYATVPYPTPQFQPKRIYKITPTGELLFHSIQMGAGDGYLSERGGISWIYDSLIFVQPGLVFDKKLNPICDVTPPTYRDPSYSCLEVGDGTFLIDGILYKNVTWPTYDVFSYVFRSDPETCDSEPLLEQFVTTGAPADIYVSSARYGLAYVDSNHIYQGYVRDGGLFQTSTNNVVVTSFRLDGTINWSYYFGGDAPMIPIAIVPYPDGKVLFLVNVYRAGTSGMDIEYVLFDELGNLVTSSTNNLANQQSSVILYPNPSSDLVKLAFVDSENVDLLLYDCFGRLVLSKKSISQNDFIDLSILQNGVYIYQAYENGKIRGSGKLLKY